MYLNCKINERMHKKLARKWMRRKWAGNLLWRAFSYPLAAAAFYLGWCIYRDFCLNPANPDVVVPMAIFAVAVTLVGLVIALAPYKLWRILAGGQLYYLKSAGVGLEDDQLRFYYHPRHDRAFPDSLAFNTIRYRDIKRVVVDRHTRLVRIEGDARFELLRKAFGVHIPVDDEKHRFDKWGMMKFFLAFEDNGEADFWKTLADKDVPVEYTD